MLNPEELSLERRLVEASRKKPAQFARLYERYFDRVYAFALTRTGDRSLAEDVTAETFRRAFQNIQGFEWRGVPFSAWLFRIASNAALDQLKRSGRQAAAPEGFDGGSLDSHFAEIEERARLSELVQRLPLDQARVLVMRFVKGLSTREVAEATGRTEGAVKALQARALSHLRRWIRESDD
ncbi:MAG: sigma-70 family RNA polymerase sigma factor [Dehalococcoidia bacterium]